MVRSQNAGILNQPRYRYAYLQTPRILPTRSMSSMINKVRDSSIRPQDLPTLRQLAVPSQTLRPGERARPRRMIDVVCPALTVYESFPAYR